jgi:hypothetical protein
MSVSMLRRIPVRSAAANPTGLLGPTGPFRTIAVVGGVVTTTWATGTTGTTGATSAGAAASTAPRAIRAALTSLAALTANTAGATTLAIRASPHPHRMQFFGKLGEFAAVELAVAVRVERHRMLDHSLGRRRPAPRPVRAARRTAAFLCTGTARWTIFAFRRLGHHGRSR